MENPILVLLESIGHLIIIFMLLYVVGNSAVVFWLIKVSKKIKEK